MKNANPAAPAAEESAVHEAQVDHYIAAMQRLQEQMADDRQEILALQAETRAILDDVMVTLKAN